MKHFMNKGFKESVEDLIWKIKYDKPRPNLPFRIEEEEVNKIVDQILKLYEKEKKKRDKLIEEACLRRIRPILNLDNESANCKVCGYDHREMKKN